MSFLFSHAVGRVIFFAPKEVLLILRFDALKAVSTSVVRGSRECLAFVSQKINVSPVIGSLCVPSFGFYNSTHCKPPMVEILLKYNTNNPSVSGQI